MIKDKNRDKNLGGRLDQAARWAMLQGRLDCSLSIGNTTVSPHVYIYIYISLFLNKIYLHEAAEAEGCVGKARLFQKILGAGLDAHQGHVAVAVAVVDAEEDIALDAHRLHAVMG